MQVQPYLFFDGRCDEALAFYKSAVGATVDMLMRFKDSPDKSACSPGSDDKVMHAQFQVGDTKILASDGRNGGQPKFEGFALTIAARDEADADRISAR
jgi:PhnB protein